MNFAKFLRTPFITEHFLWLLLSFQTNHNVTGTDLYSGTFSKSVAAVSVVNVKVFISCNFYFKILFF